MFRRFTHALLIVAFIVATGGHWTLLQTVAWSTMLAENLHTASFTEAVQRTFDGKHPCSLCKRISAAKKSEKKTEYPTPLKKLEFVSERIAFVFSAPSDFQRLRESELSPRGLTTEPLLPPPRSLLG